MSSGEDGDFCQRVNNKYGNVYALDIKLLNYLTI